MKQGNPIQQSFQNNNTKSKSELKQQNTSAE